MDRETLRVTLCSFIDPLDPSSHPEGVVNMANLLVSTNNVNVDKALELGQQQMDEFETGLPSSFHKTLKKMSSQCLMLKNPSKLKEHQYMIQNCYTPKS